MKVIREKLTTFLNKKRPSKYEKKIKYSAETIPLIVIELHILRTLNVIDNLVQTFEK